MVSWYSVGRSHWRFSRASETLSLLISTDKFMNINCLERSWAAAESEIFRDDRTFGCVVRTDRRLPFPPWRWQTVIGNYTSARVFSYGGPVFLSYAELNYPSGLTASSAFAIHNSIVDQLDRLGESGVNVRDAVCTVVEELATRIIINRKVLRV